jgi:hypothetical protein
MTQSDPCASGFVRRTGAEGGKQLGRGPCDELLLGFAADLDQRKVVEAGALEVAYPGDVSVDVGTAGHPGRHVFLAHGLRCRVERCGNRELGVDSPVAGELAELIHRALHGDLRIGVVGERDLTDAGLPGTSGSVEHLLVRRALMTEEFGKGPAMIEMALVKPPMVHSSDPVVDPDE